MNNQQISKIITFFRTNYDLHQPYNFLLDGNFIKTMLQKQMTSSGIQTKLEAMLNGKARMYTTSCVIRELELLGHQFRLVLEEARKVRGIRCGHEIEMTVDTCLSQQAIKDSKMRFVVCSQDIELRRNLRLQKGVPLMYFGPDQRVTMEDIQKKNKEDVYDQVQMKMKPKEGQLNEINQYHQDQKIKMKYNERREKLKMAKISGLKYKKRSKGANPLSFKKKKQDHKEQSVKKVQGEGKKKRIRKRKNKDLKN